MIAKLEKSVKIKSKFIKGKFLINNVKLFQIIKKQFSSKMY